MVPHAADAEAEASQDPFRALNRAQLLAGYLGVCGMREDRQADAGSSHVAARRDDELADLRFRQVHVVERAVDAEFARRLAPRPVITTVIRVRTVDDRRDAARSAAILVNTRYSSCLQ